MAETDEGEENARGLERMNEKLVKIILGFLAIVLVVRFGWPLMFGSKSGPFGNPYMVNRSTTLLFESDLRFYGVLMMTLAGMFVVMLRDIHYYKTLITIVMAGTFVGGVIRVVEIFVVGVPEPPAIVATIVEVVFPY